MITINRIGQRTIERNLSVGGDMPTNASGRTITAPIATNKKAIPTRVNRNVIPYRCRRLRFFLLVDYVKGIEQGRYSGVGAPQGDDEEHKVQGASCAM